MKKFVVFTLFFLLGTGALVGVALLALQAVKDKPFKTAIIEASLLEPAAGETVPDADLMPATAPEGSVTQDVSETHPLLRLTPDKTEMVALEGDAQSIVVGNPDHASVLMENPRTLLVVPRQPGATYFSVLDKDGKVLMQRHVIVAAPKEKYVRIRRSCANASGSDSNCEPMTVYYCPDMCHEVSTTANAGTQSN